MVEAARIFNFSSGPGTLPTEVLEIAREQMLSFAGSGMSVIEMSHRSEVFQGVLEKAENGIRDLLQLPDDFKVLFLQGGATLQFSMVPMNFLPKNKTADYLVTGAWGEKAVGDAKKFGNINVVFDGKKNEYKNVPRREEIELSTDAAYVHYTSNETIDGVEFKYDLSGFCVPVVCDASSNILSKPIDIDRYDLIYAGAQKNIGPSGVTVVIIRDSLLERIPDGLPRMLDYREYATHDSMPNTPNTWGIYLIGLVCDWLKTHSGVDGIAKVNAEKAAILYDAIDSSDGFYKGHAARDCRSLMNVTFRLPNDELDKLFCAKAEKNAMSGLRGHRSVGGVRASIYNAFPKEGVEHLVEFMSDFASKNR
ncbi:MAG: 3-phosphoserine/phosphohydroxythreonine transaminase [Pyrinomonadaceae bacterium]